jgi:hypothetical protein
MADRRQDPTRWRDHDAEAHGIESRAALLTEAAIAVQPLSGPALARIRDDINARRGRRGWLGGAALPLQVRLALVLAMLMVGGTTAVGARLLWRRHANPEQPAAPAQTIPAKNLHAASRAAVRGPGEMDAPTPVEAPQLPVAPGTPAAAPVPPPVVDVPATPRGRPAASGPIDERPHAAVERARVESVEPPPLSVRVASTEPSPPPQPTEASLIAQALVDLRQHNDPRAALATLDRYGRDFAHGVLEAEALRTRVEAVIQLGDLNTALTLLDGKGGGGGAAGDDLLLTRAELRASAGRFGEALADFNQVMHDADGSSISGSDQRALYGRAVCLGRLGQSERARADLILYQRWFPHGRFAVEVQRLLAGGASAARP